jgi:hypothetical protein
MGAIENLQKLYDRKQQEVRQLEVKLREASAYLQAIQDSMKVLSREANGATVDSEEQTLRPGTSLALARDVLRASGKALHVTELLKQMGKPTDKKTRVSLSSTLASYARDGQVFTRPAPNTFGLLEFSTIAPSASESGVAPAVVPESFGKMQIA